MSYTKSHAESELRLAGLFDKDSDYEGKLAGAVMELIEVFTKQGHSGMSASMTIELFTKLARQEPLTKITSDPKEWNDISDYSNNPKWQNRRDSRCFSNNGGKTWWCLQDKKWWQFWK